MRTAHQVIVGANGGPLLSDEQANLLIEGDDITFPLIYNTAGDPENPAPCTAWYWAHVVQDMVGPDYSVGVFTVNI